MFTLSASLYFAEIEEPTGPADRPKSHSRCLSIQTRLQGLHPYRRVAKSPSLLLSEWALWVHKQPCVPGHDYSEDEEEAAS